MFRAFHVFLKLQKPCKYQHFLRSSRQKCCNLRCFFACAFKHTGICSVLCISGPKSIGIYSIFCVFAWLPQKTLKRKNAVIDSILWLSKSEKSSEKCVKTALFFPILGTLQIVGGRDFALGDAYERPGFRPKSSPRTLLKDFWCFSGPGVGGSAAWGTPHHRALVALGRSWRICQRTRVEPAEPNFWADAHRRLRRTTRPSISSQCGRERYWMRTCRCRNIFLMVFWNIFVGIMEPRFFSWSKWGRRVPESSCEGFFLKNCCQFQLVHFV